MLKGLGSSFTFAWAWARSTASWSTRPVASSRHVRQQVPQAGQAAVASWDKAQKQTVIQPIDLGKGAPLDAIRVQGRLLCRPLQVGDRMICTVEKPGHLVTLKVF